MPCQDTSIKLVPNTRGNLLANAQSVMAYGRTFNIYEFKMTTLTLSGLLSESCTVMMKNPTGTMACQYSPVPPDLGDWGDASALATAGMAEKFGLIVGLELATALIGAGLLYYFHKQEFTVSLRTYEHATNLPAQMALTGHPVASVLILIVTSTFVRRMANINRIYAGTNSVE